MKFERLPVFMFFVLGTAVFASGLESGEFYPCNGFDMAPVLNPDYNDCTKFYECYRGVTTEKHCDTAGHVADFLINDCVPEERSTLSCKKLTEGKPTSA